MAFRSDGLTEGLAQHRSRPSRTAMPPNRRCTQRMWYSEWGPPHDVPSMPKRRPCHTLLREALKSLNCPAIILCSSYSPKRNVNTEINPCWVL